MKKSIIVLLCITVLIAINGCSLLSSAMGGGNADVSLTYTRYPLESFGNIKNIAVLPFEDGALDNSWSLWDYLERKYTSNSLSIVMADNLTGKLAAKKSFKLFDRNIAKNDSAVEMVISGVIAVHDVNTDANEKVYTDKQGYQHYSYEAICSGIIGVNYRLINPKSGEIIKTINIEKRYSQNASDASRREALNKLPGRTQVLNSLIDQANNEFISSFTPVEITASYALATIKEDENFKKSLLLAKKNDWVSAVDIWSRYEEQNCKEAFYNKMLYKRYIEQNLSDAIAYAQTSYQKSGDAAFAKWITKFEREQSLENEYKNPGSSVPVNVAPPTPLTNPAGNNSGAAKGIEAGY